MKVGILIGTHYHSGDEATRRRQANANVAIRSLQSVRCVNLQFADGPIIEEGGFATIPLLRNDSCKNSGLVGRRTPVLNEMCSRLAEIAVAEGWPYFMLVNSDEIVMAPAIAVVLSQGLEGYIFSRMDFSHETGQDLGILSGGQGCWVFKTEWWLENGWRIRPYVMGEAFLDTIMTTKMLCHGRARLFNRTGEFIRHEAHPRRWPDSSFLNYTRFLASLDGLYLSIWHEYISRLDKLRAINASELEEALLQAEVFKYQPSFVKRLKQAGRSQKAHVRFRIQRYFGKRQRR